MALLDKAITNCLHLHPPSWSFSHALIIMAAIDEKYIRLLRWSCEGTCPTFGSKQACNMISKYSFEMWHFSSIMGKIIFYTILAVILCPSILNPTSSNNFFFRSTCDQHKTETKKVANNSVHHRIIAYAHAW